MRELLNKISTRCVNLETANKKFAKINQKVHQQNSKFEKIIYGQQVSKPSKSLSGMKQVKSEKERSLSFLQLKKLTKHY